MPPDHRPGAFPLESEQVFQFHDQDPIDDLTEAVLRVDRHAPDIAPDRAFRKGVLIGQQIDLLAEFCAAERLKGRWIGKCVFSAGAYAGHVRIERKIVGLSGQIGMAVFPDHSHGSDAGLIAVCFFHLRQDGVSVQIGGITQQLFVEIDPVGTDDVPDKDDRQQAEHGFSQNSPCLGRGG